VGGSVDMNAQWTNSWRSNNCPPLCQSRAADIGGIATFVQLELERTGAGPSPLTCRVLARTTRLLSSRERYWPVAASQPPILPS
jgi:hypothetical protein